MLRMSAVSPMVKYLLSKVKSLLLRFPTMFCHKTFTFSCWPPPPPPLPPSLIIRERSGQEVVRPDGQRSRRGLFGKLLLAISFFSPTAVTNRTEAHPDKLILGEFCQICLASVSHKTTIFSWWNYRKTSQLQNVFSRRLWGLRLRQLTWPKTLIRTRSWTRPWRSTRTWWRGRWGRSLGSSSATLTAASLLSGQKRPTSEIWLVVHWVGRHNPFGVISTPYFLSHNNQLKKYLFGQMISPRWPTSWWLRWTPIALFSTRGPCEAISSTRPGSSVSGWVIFAANGDSNDFSGLAGHPSHDGWPHSPWRLRRDDPQGEEAKLLLLKCSYVEIVENSFLERAIHIFMEPWPTKTGWQAHLSYVDYFYRACSINMCLWIDFEYQVEDSGLQRSALELMRWSQLSLKIFTFWWKALQVLYLYSSRHPGNVFSI